MRTYVLISTPVRQGPRLGKRPELRSPEQVRLFRVERGVIHPDWTCPTGRRDCSRKEYRLIMVSASAQRLPLDILFD